MKNMNFEMLLVEICPDYQYMPAEEQAIIREQAREIIRFLR